MLQRILLVFLTVFLLIPACTGAEDKEQTAVFKQETTIQEIKPQNPVKIKLKRNTKGKYSWDISGNNADEVLKADRKLKESLGEKGGEQK